jgi:hypothetical protein
VVEQLPSKQEAQSSTPLPPKKKKKVKERNNNFKNLIQIAFEDLPTTYSVYKEISL